MIRTCFFYVILKGRNRGSVSKDVGVMQFDVFTNGRNVYLKTTDHVKRCVFGGSHGGHLELKLFDDGFVLVIFDRTSMCSSRSLCFTSLSVEKRSGCPNRVSDLVSKFFIFLWSALIWTRLCEMFVSISVTICVCFSIMSIVAVGVMSNSRALRLFISSSSDVSVRDGLCHDKRD